jgi:hypothetical protein
MRDPVPGDLAVLAMTMFAPMVFLQTAVDVLIAGAILGASAILGVAFVVVRGGERRAARAVRRPDHGRR